MTAVDERDGVTAAPPAHERRSTKWNAALMPPERSRALRPTVSRLARLLWTERTWVAVAILTASLSVVLNALGPHLLGQSTDVIVEASGEGDLDGSALRRLLLQATGVYIGSAVLALVSAYTLAGVVQRLMHRLRQDVEDKVHRLTLRYLDREARGDLLSRLTNDVDNLGQSLQQTLSQLLSSVLLLLAIAAAMLAVSPLLGLVALTVVPLSLVAVKQVARRARPQYTRQWGDTGALNAIVEEACTGHAVVKAYGRQEEVEDRFRAANEAVYSSSWRAQGLGSLMLPISVFLGNLQYVAMAVVGGLRVASGAVTIGEVQAFLLYARTFSMPLTQLASVMTLFQSGMASLERVLDLLDAEEETPDVWSTATAAAAGRVAFEDVTFSYDAARPLLQGLWLTVEPGQTVAIVGPTGAGKTTLVNLLMRFYELDGGRILVDGRSIADLPRAELRGMTGMVLQDTWLFGGTIRDNIRYGRPDATEEQVQAAARATYVDRFVHALPHGYDTVVDEEADALSAGEKQLLTIARAFLADPVLLILDEATSSVDTRTEVLVQEAMNRLRASRTSFVIAHRLSTIRGADLVLVMEDGRIVEQGAPEQLLAAGGAFAALHAAQFASAAVEIE